MTSSNGKATTTVYKLELAIHLTEDDISTLRAFLLEEGVPDADAVGPAGLVDRVLLWALEVQRREDKTDAR